MGEIIARKIKGMSWKSRIGLVLVFTMLFSALIYESWYMREAHSAIGNSGWTTIYSNTAYPNNASVSYTMPAGSGRLLIVAISSTRSTVGTQTYTVSYGGQSLTRINGDETSATPQDHTALYYLNEAGIVAAGGTGAHNFTLTITGGTSWTNIIYANTLTNVDQGAPITNSRNYSSGTGTTTTPTFATALTENTNDQPIVIMNSSRTASGTARTIAATANWTIPASGSAGNMTLANGTSVAMRAGALTRSIPTSNTSDTQPGTISAATIASMTGVSVKAATTTLGTGANGTTGNVCPGDTQKLGGFSFQTTSSGTDTVSGLTVTLTNYTAIQSLAIWNEAGTTQYFSSVTPGSNSVSFTGGTSIPVAAAASNYKIMATYKTRAQGAPSGSTATTGYVSSFTPTSLIAAGSDTADTTLTLTNPASTSASWGSNTAGDGQNTLNWTYGTSGQSVLIVRYTANTDTATPADGTTYTVGNSFGTGGTVRYVGNGTNPQNWVDNVGISNGTTYYYKIFEYDSCTLYSSGVWSSGLTPVASDTTAPTVTAFTVTTPTSNLNIPITSFTASDNVGVTGFCITTSASQPAASACTTFPAPGTYNVGGAGTYTLYPWARDAVGNVSAVFGGTTVVVDQSAPTYTTWTAPSAGSYYKDGGAISVDVTISDTGAGVTNGANCNAKIDGATSSFSGSVTYSTGTGKCTGTLTLGGPSGLTDGAHNLTLQVADSAGNSAQSSPRSINIDNTAPTGLSVLSPSDSASDVLTNATLQVNAASDSGSGSVQYYFQIATDLGFTQNVQNSGWQSGTTWAPTLAHGTQYYWHVGAKDAVGNQTGYITSVFFSTIATCIRNDPSVTLLTSGGDSTATISTNAGTAVYVLKITNHDYGDCGNTSFNFSVADTNSNQFVASTPSATTTGSLTTGQMYTGSVTVTARSGSTSGQNKTHVTTASDANHSAIQSQPDATTTLNVIVWNKNVPYLIIGPNSGNAALGGYLDYTVTVQNNDTGTGASPVTFNLTLSDSNSDDFDASKFIVGGSPYSTTSLTLNSGQRGAVTLRVYSKSGTSHLTKTDITTINVTATGHASPDPATATTTIGNTILHNSINMGSTKWASFGGWGVPGGMYGEFNCETCHLLSYSGAAGETPNIKRIKQQITTPDTALGTIPGDTGWNTIVFDRLTGTSLQGVLGYDNWDTVNSRFATPRTSSNKICEYCHTYDATGANGVHAHAFAVGVQLGNHNNADGGDCITCHTHNLGFTPSVGSCDGCHGAPPGYGANEASFASSYPGYASSHTTHYWFTAGGLPTEYTGNAIRSVSGGYVFECGICHSVILGDHRANTDGIVDVKMPGGSASVPWGWFTRGGTSVNHTRGAYTFYDANSTCSSTYCHGNFTGGNASNVVTWGLSSSADCGTCHGASAGNPPSGGVHSRHVGGSTMVALTCDICHNNVVGAGGGTIADKSKHVNMATDWNLKTWDSRVGAAATYKSGVWGSNPTVGSNYGSCSTVYCHSNIQGSNGTGGPTSFGSPNWGGTPLTCSTANCHHPMNTAGGTGSHQTHASTYPINCNVCHSGAGKDTAQHGNYAINLWFSGSVSAGTAYSRGTSITPGTAYGTCTTSYCHSTGTTSPTYASPAPIWGNAGSATCGTCHGATAANPPASGSHPKHAGWNTTSGYVYQFYCYKCHNTVVTNAATAAIASYALHVNGTRDVGLDGGGNWNDPGASQCNSSYCHSNAKWSSVVYANPTWGNSGSVGCGDCHGNPPAYASSGAGLEMANSHVKHVTNSGIGCQRCHYNTTLDGTTIRIDINPTNHVDGSSVNGNATKDVVFPDGGWYSYGAGNKTCTATYCHGSPATKPQWGGTTSCASCHQSQGSDSSTAQASFNGPHEKHTSTGTYKYTFSCEMCHALSNTTYGTITHSGGKASGTNPGNGSVGTYQYAEIKYRDWGTSSWSVGAYRGSAVTTYKYRSLYNNPYTSESAVSPTYASGTNGAVDSVNANIQWSTLGSCTNIWCHSNANPMTRGSETAWNTFKNPFWGMTLGCNGCHRASGDTWNTMTSTSVGDRLSTSHADHMASDMYGAQYTCAKCHNATVLDNLTISSFSNHVNGVKNIAFDSWSPSGSWASPVCSNVYCHSTASPLARSGESLSNTYRTVAWTSISLGCNGCHRASGENWNTMTTTPDRLSTSHAKHMASDRYGAQYTCNACHSATTSNSTTITGWSTHVNNSKNVSFSNSFNSAATYNGSPNYTCGNTYCHSDGTGGTSYTNDPRAVATNTSTAWNIATSSTPLACDACHGFPPSYSGTKANSHVKHVTTNNITCDYCHYGTTTWSSVGASGGWGSIANYANHVSGQYNIAANAAKGVSIGSYTWATNGGTCTNASCHPANPAKWGGSSLGCNGCHPYTASDWAAASTFWTTEAKGAHIKHINHLVQLYPSPALTAASDTYGTGAAANICGTCHTNTATNHRKLAWYTNRMVNFGDGVYKSGGASGFNFQFGASVPVYNGVTGVGSATTPKTCSNVSCHFRDTMDWQAR